MKAQPQGWRWKATLLVALALCSLRGLSASAMGNPNERYAFDIPQGVAAWRLNDFGTQSGMQLLFNFEDMKGVSVAAVHGEYKPFDALNRMIAGTDIHYEFVNRRTVTLTRAAMAMRPSKALRDKVDASKGGNDDRRSSGAGLDEVTIRGTQPSSLSLLGSRIMSVSRADLDASGFVTTQGVIRTLPQVFGGGPSEDTVFDTEARTNVGRGTGVNLRGLGAGSTLVLMNGRRLPGSGSEGQYVDVSNLPLAAIERIDILPDSSSTFFGSDAVGGVANFVMRDRFDGRQTEAYFGNTTRSGHVGEKYVSQIVGGHNESGHGLFAFDFYSRDNLTAASRDMARSDLTEYGGSNFDTPQSAPGNITLGGTTWAVPHGQDGTNLKPGDFVKGSPNLQDRFLGSDILPVQRRLTGFGTWRQSLTDRLTLFGDLLLGQRDVRVNGTGVASPIVIPVTNAFYAAPVALPSRVPLVMTYSFYDDLGPQFNDIRILSGDFTGGLERRFGDDWKATATVGYATEHTRSDASNVVNAAALNAALASSDRSTAFNPFGDGSHTNPATLESLRGFVRAIYDSRVTSASVLAGGPLLALPGGKIELSFGSDTRKQRFESTLQANTIVVPTDNRADRDRSIHSAFAELRVPIVGPSNRLPGIEALAISVAERYEHYSDFGGAATPRFGLSWAPRSGVTLLGSYSASFHPPGLLDLDESNNVWAIQTLRDAQGQPTSVLLWSGKNRDLQQETAHSWTAGVEFEPVQHPEIAVAFTYFDTDFNDRLSRPVPTADLLTNPTLSALVTRSPPAELRADVCSRSPRSGSVTGDCLTTPIAAIVDLRTRNDAIVETRGIDMLARYERASRLGRFSFSLNGTYILSFAEAKAVDLPLVERVSTQSYPIDLKMRGTVRWQRAGFDVATDVNFMNNYRDEVSAPQRSVSSWTTVDLHAAYTFGAAGGGWLGDTTFALGADNLFDKDPPFLNNSTVGIGYDQENGDLTGRTVNFTVRKKW
jgi:outer membrane receptor protein involved in Fe transport